MNDALVLSATKYSMPDGMQVQRAHRREDSMSKSDIAVTRQVRSFSAPSTRYMIDLRAVWQNLRADRIRESWFIEHNNEGSGTQCCTNKNPTVLRWSCLRYLRTPIDSIDTEYVCGDFVSLRIVKIPK